MSTLLRALRPSRNDLKKAVTEKPSLALQGNTDEERAASLIDLELYTENLVAKRASFNQLYAKLVSVSVTDPATQKVIEEQAEQDTVFLSQVDGIIAELSVGIKHHYLMNKAIAVEQPNHHQQTVNLPKLGLPTFDGTITKWQEFWDCFDASVHRNQVISPVDKMNYLRAQLTDAAKRAISGLAATAENYEAALTILKERFGNTQLVIDAHYTALTALSPATARKESLRHLVDAMEQHLNSLEALGEQVNHRHFIAMIKEKLPPLVVIHLEEQRADAAWNVDAWRQHIRRYLSVREAAERNVSTNSVDPSPMNRPRGTEQRLGSSFHSTETFVADARHRNAGAKTPPCIFCGRNNHWSDDCRRYTTLEDWRQQLRGRCFNCLKAGHAVRNCHRDTACVYCKVQKNHHRSLCPQKYSGLAAPTPRDDRDSNRNARPTGATTNHLAEEATLLTSGEQSLLQTAVTTVHSATPGGHVNSCQVRLLLDSGSQRSYVTEELAKKLNAPPLAKETLSVFTFGSTKPLELVTTVVKLKLTLLDGTPFEISANVVPKINACCERTSVDVKKFGHLYATLPLADPAPLLDHPCPTDLLLGNDFYWDIITSERIELTKGLYLIGSKLGWILTGRTKEAPFWKDKPSMVMLTSVQSARVTELPFVPVDAALMQNCNLPNLWDLETIGIHNKPDESDDDKALQNFTDTVQFVDNRYYVTWPWKENCDSLPSNYCLALGRLNSLLRRLGANPELFSKYHDIIQSQLDKGIIEPVDAKERPSHQVHYIPHHAVITPDKATTKVRIVYDGSAKATRNQPSLNECLYRGPVILEEIVHLLIRFRLHPIALIADIEKAFLQVGLQEKDRDVTRFLWLNDTNRMNTEQNLQTYRFARVPFGVISSPFLLAATIIHHLDKEGSETAKNIASNLYVDNLVTGANSVPAAIRFYNEAKRIFQSASMNIREWASNSPDLMAAIPESDQLTGAHTTVLGISWNMNSDVLNVPPSGIATDLHLTKRTVLKSLAGVFDPLGLFCPVTLPAKLFLHRLGTANLNWDDVLSADQVNDWRLLAAQLDAISAVQLPRYIGVSSADPVHYELHCFCDASQAAYGTCVYLRTCTSSYALTQLLFAKSRVAPQRQITLPSLELLAMHIGNRCLAFVERGLTFAIASRHLWSDSQCVLHWLKSPKSLSVFVANRVKELRLAQHVTFHYVPTGDNPADLASRGTTLPELRTNTLWWNGPVWLHESEASWPSDAHVPSFDSELLQHIASEERPTVLYGASLLAQEGSGEKEKTDNPAERNLLGIDETRYSSLTRLLRVTAWGYRYLHNLRHKDSRLKGPLTSEEIRNARLVWVNAIQESYFSDVHESIRKSTRHPLRDALGLWLDDQGIVRCKGRLVNADINYDSAYPTLLPKRSHFTSLVIRDYHLKLFHAGVTHTLSQIRHEFWIPSGRSEVFKFIKGCKSCVRWDGGPYRPPEMPSLPKVRVTRSTPFQWTGLDYLGPLYVKINGTAEKVWICLFTCMVTRAIHLELVENLTTAAFLMALKRFIARRGKPECIWSDNAATFKLAKSVLDKIWGTLPRDETVQAYISSSGIRWSFIVEKAPWMGGFYERLVQLVKRALRKSLMRLCLTLVQLQTIITEIEAMLNTRPLVYVGSDFLSGPALTPAHFLCLNPKLGLPAAYTCNAADDADYVEEMDSPTAVLEMWKRGEHHLKTFWSIWKNDYLLNLRERQRMTLKFQRGSLTMIPQVGDVVHVKADLPRGSWQLARITELCHSTDGEIRSAKVMLPSGKILSRAVVHLYPLETSGETRRTSDSRSTAEDTAIAAEDDDPPGPGTARPTRGAATKAMEKITKIHEDEDEDDM